MAEFLEVKFNKAILNSRRLRPGQLKQRYRRLKYTAGVSHDELWGQEQVDCNENEPVYFDTPIASLWLNETNRYETASVNEAQYGNKPGEYTWQALHWELTNYLASIHYLPMSQLELLTSMLEQKRATYSKVTAMDLAKWTKTEYEKRYLALLEQMMLDVTQAHWNVLKRNLRCLSAHDITMLKQYLSVERASLFWVLIVLLQPFWIRSLSTWPKSNHSFSDVKAKHRSVLTHLFQKYEVPEFLLLEWDVYTGIEEQTRLYETKWIAWYLLFAQGISLYRAARRFNWSISKQTSQYLYEEFRYSNPRENNHNWDVVNLGGHPNYPQGLRYLMQNQKRFDAGLYAFVRVSGGSARVYETLSSFRYSIYDLTSNDKVVQCYRTFLRDKIKWLQRNITTIDESVDFTDPLMMEYYEVGYVLEWAIRVWFMLMDRGMMSLENLNLCRLRNRGLASAFNLAKEDEEKLFLAGLPSRSWKGKGWDWRFKDESGNDWTITELTDDKALYVEGKSMHHCVFNYADKCVNNECAIFSVVKNELACLTVELEWYTAISNINCYVILGQIKGKHNRCPQEEEQTVVNRWIAWINKSFQRFSLSRD